MGSYDLLAESMHVNGLLHAMVGVCTLAAKISNHQIYFIFHSDWMLTFFAEILESVVEAASVQWVAGLEVLDAHAAQPLAVDLVEVFPAESGWVKMEAACQVVYPVHYVTR
jgi:hypothetical protein